MMKNIDWSKLSFSYTQTKALVYSRCIDGKWETPTVTENFNICLNSFAGIFHYAPSCFEGLKAFRGVDGRIRLFRPDKMPREWRTARLIWTCRTLQRRCSSICAFNA